ncbi:MAG: alpha/beta hydrolase [Okeania sp. SIO3I5]|uniref:alpha/beta hydrolase n=1 Tax=Okeania sp. SIO3I5 TaxID=2607805 RepID=UPI0013B97774|nr:alpha/beta hydrolase [Okeania sp. SIO3I5]NEQ35413.1 alpha/beta hydrolase [Okeania sp. SIO3I5]
MQEDKIITIRENIYAIKEKVDGKTEIPYREIIILVHGYNVSEEGATVAYKKFEKNFSKYSSQLSKLNKAIYWFMWPSDKLFLSPLFYFQAVKKAKICGERFAEYLNKLNLISTNNQPPSITLIGHSLGCRLLLEALKKTIKTNLKLEIFLMAPAVPVSIVKPDKPLNPSISSTEKYRILHSRKDGVLNKFFGIGQAMAGEGFDEAVGLKGNPNTGVWSNTKETTYDHSDYWGGEESVEWIASQLGILKTVSRNLKLQRPTTAFEGRELTIASESREIKTREIPWR